jgi:hypothetical protein
MDMTGALIAHLEELLASGRLAPEQHSKAVDELHRARRRVVKQRDRSKDSEPIVVGVRI